MRNYERNTEQDKTLESLMQKAAHEIIDNNEPIKTIAKKYNICYMKLSPYVKKLRSGTEVSVGDKKVRLFFNGVQQTVLLKYINQLSSIFFGLSSHEVRKVAYECAKKFRLQNIPLSWYKYQMASYDWMTAFQTKHDTMKIRSSEANFSTRATNFNRFYINKFYSRLADILDRYDTDLPPGRIYNLDEMGLQTTPKNVQFNNDSRVAPADIEDSPRFVTLVIAVNALGYTLPVVYVYPTLPDKQRFIRNRGRGSYGIESISGKISTQEFAVYLDFFIEQTRPTPTDPVLLLLDNNPIHISIDVLEKAKANSIILLSFPLDCARRLQPLDAKVNATFKNFCYKARDQWIKSDPDKTISVYEIPEIVKHALPLAATPTNIINSFITCGIWPYNPNAVTDVEIDVYNSNRYLAANLEAKERVIYLQPHEMNKKDVDYDQLFDDVCKNVLEENSGDKAEGGLLEFEEIKIESDPIDTECFVEEGQDGDSENAGDKSSLGYFEIVDCDRITKFGSDVKNL